MAIPVMMKSMDFSKYLGYSISCVSLCVGLLFVSGMFLPPTIPVQLRIMVGVVFLLMSIYRFVATRYKIREQQRAER